MSGYALRRLLVALPTLLGLSLLVFTLATVAPGDPAEEYARRTSPTGEVTQQDIERARRELRLNRPFAVQYVDWAGSALRGDLGRSFSRRTPVRAEIGARLVATVELATAALFLTVLLGGPLGVVAAVLHRHWLDHLLRIVALAAASVPGFFLAYLLIGIFAVQFGLFPVAGRQGAAALVLPAITLAVGPAARVSRLLRSSLLEVLGEDYILTARAKGLTFPRVVVRHGVRNALIPVLTVLGSVLGHLLGGAVIVEYIFAWPGLGQLTVDAVFQRDYPMILGLVVLAGVVFLVINLLVDLSYTLLDPRVRLEFGS